MGDCQWWPQDSPSPSGDEVYFCAPGPTSSPLALWLALANGKLTCIMQAKKSTWYWGLSCAAAPKNPATAAPWPKLSWWMMRDTWPTHLSHPSQQLGTAKHQSRLPDQPLSTDPWGGWAKTSSRSWTQPQLLTHGIISQIHSCHFGPPSFGVVYHAAKANKNS